MAKSDLEFSNRDDLEAWLADKPIDWSQVIATRAALRVIPFVWEYSPELTLMTFRANFISWAASNYPAHDMRAAAFAARSADTAARSAAARSADAAARSASAAARSASAAARSASARSAAYAADSASAAARSAADSADASLMWQKISMDAAWLEEMDQAHELIRQPLWPVGKNDTKSSRSVPEWVLERLNDFSNFKISKLKYSHLLLDWYRALLPTDGSKIPFSFFGEEADLTIALKPNEFWKRAEKGDEGIEAVLADIAKIVDGTYEGDPSPTQKKVSQEKVSQETFQPAERTDVKPKSDEPTSEDELGRRPFAESLVDKINEVREAGQRDGFAVHLHAPWGAGKTSILLMMQDYMKRSAKKETRDNNWVVVNFNAWEHERRKPPWWPLIEAVERDCSAYLAEQAGIRNNKKPWQEVDDCLKSITQSHFRSSVKSWIGHKFRWCWWKLKTDWLPLVVFLIFGGLIYFLLDKSELITNTPDQSFFMTFLKNLFPLILAAAGLYATFLSATRSMVFGSKDSANYYFQLSNDPLGRIHHLFNKLIDGVDRPVCIFIDDLDRCHADFVVDLLEGIQSSFRHEKVTYVVAADKGWIRSAFETRYDSFKDHVGDPAQPLGYLFLEKIFQMSTPIPGMAAYVKEEYFNHLLDAKLSEEEVADFSDDYNEKVESAQRSMEEALPGGATAETIKTYVSNNLTPENVAAGVRILEKSPEAERQSKHFLIDFAPMLSGNPREMKRLLNAFVMRRTLWLIETTTVSLEELFRWTIIEQSYPALADLLSDCPDLIKHFESRPNKEDDSDKNIPSELKPFVEIDAIYQIVNGFGHEPLTSEIIHNITKGFGNYS